VGPLARLIAHHAGWTTLIVEIAVVVAALGLFGGIWLRERRRRADRSRRVPEMRD
jgi:hypothetical protein